MIRKRNSTIFLAMILVVIAAVVGWIAGSNIISPAEAAARTAPPRPSPILVPIETRVLSTDIVTRGTARFGLPQAISIVPSGLKPEAGIVTSLPTQNTQLHEGDVILTVSGRPVFIFQGEVPAFRDLVPGLVGDDVRQLEDALQRLGFKPGSVDGIYDEQTSMAVAEWYGTAGWEPFGPMDEQLAHIRDLERELAVAISNQLSAEDVVARASLEIEAARANANTANLLAVADVAAKTGIRDNVVSDANATPQEGLNANADLEAAKAAETATQLEGDLAIQSALDAQKVAEREFSMATELVNQLRSDLDTARGRTGMHVPADEIVFVPTLPVRIDQIDGVIGDTASGAMMTVTNNQLAIDSALPLDEAPLVRPGMAVTIDEPDLGITATGVVAQIADAPGTFGVDGFHVYFEILVDETPLALDGFSLRLTIPIETTEGAVTTIPISALSLAADGTSRVQVENNGILEFVIVEPGLSADGFVEVTPIEGTLMPGQMVVIGFENAS
jgi:peptidoglycan hydrolase-like protein with peptidoglycan-binding domain